MADFAIESLLQKSIGLKVTTIGKTALDRAVQRRMRALLIDEKADYQQILNSSAFELKELIEEVVIPETWFFRDREPFKVMTEYLLSQWGPGHKNNLFRVLSAPCSTGEEPYSLAMTLFKTGWPSDKFTVYGVDISQRSIYKAKEGAYTDNSFRGVDLDYRADFFTRDKSGNYILNSNIRDKVFFQTGNILDSSFMDGLGLFNVIFFRNVLIYFDAPARYHALTTLYKILDDDGILFVGHAEANLLNNSPFTPLPHPQAFAFHKKTKPAHKSSLFSEQNLQGEEHKVRRKISTGKKLFALRQYNKTELPGLQTARDLADKGELQKATEICQTYIDQHGPSAQAFFLLGVIRYAADDLPQAENLFRKALYMDPNHEETLIFLSLLKEKTGDMVEVKKLKQRIARLRKNTVASPSSR